MVVNITIIHIHYQVVTILGSNVHFKSSDVHYSVFTVLDRMHETITGDRARLCFLPPYSPDLMPLEKVFSKVKYCLKANDNEYLATSEPDMIVKIAFCTITQDNCLKIQVIFYQCHFFKPLMTSNTSILCS